MNLRNQSIDALRGYAIITMVLSGAIAFGGVLPAWMYHAQMPPPLHKFIPSLPGITWVDLVFPFFLFSMGAAIPLALQKYLADKNKWPEILRIAFQRFFLLLFFALFAQHMKAWVIASQPNPKEHILSLVAFLLLALLLTKLTFSNKYMGIILKVFALVTAVVLLKFLPFWKGAGFDFYKGDIIIIVLANMALFGTIIYAATAKHPLLRLGILPFVLAIFLAASVPSAGWAKSLYSWKSIGKLNIDWAYQFYFLKYLFIVIPGTFVGEWIIESKGVQNVVLTKWHKNNLLAALLLLLLSNVSLLFTRLLLENLLLAILLCGVVYYLIKDLPKYHLYKKLAQVGCYLLLLGLAFEAYQGGIKKDSSTYSYYFVTSGLAMYVLLLFSIATSYKLYKPILHFMAQIGKNPMVAYVAGSLVVLPIMELLHIKHFWDDMQQNAFLGLLKGILFTAAVCGITLLFVRMKWFWKS